MTEPPSRRWLRSAGLEPGEPKPLPEPTPFTEYWARVNARTGDTEWRKSEEQFPGFENTAKEPAMVSRAITDALEELPGIQDEPCPWVHTKEGIYVNTATGQRFEGTKGTNGGILYSPVASER